MLTYNTIH